MPQPDVLRIGAALSRFWAGGGGPTRSQTESALMIAGWAGQAEGTTKQQLVTKAISESTDIMARRVIEELLSLLREDGSFESDRSPDGFLRLRRVVVENDHEFGLDGHLNWSDDPLLLPAPPLPGAGELAPLQVTVSDHSAVVAPPTGAVEAASPDLDLMISMLRRLGMGGTRPLVTRRRDRSGINVIDEYDVQDLVESLLRCAYSDIRHEEPTPSSAGTSSRIDLLVRVESTAVEVKVTAPGRAERQIKPEILVDINDYKGHPTVTTLVVAIFDLAGTFENASGFEHDLSGGHDGLHVRVVVVPWVGPRVMQ